MSSTSSVSLVGSVLDEVLAAVVASSRNVNETANLSAEMVLGVDEIEEVEPSRPTTSVPRAGQAIPLFCVLSRFDGTQLSESKLANVLFRFRADVGRGGFRQPARHQCHVS